MIGSTKARRRLSNLIKKFVREKQGVSAIEFAVVGPVFFILILGLIEFGLLFVHKTMLTHSVQETAKTVQIGQAQCYSPVQFKREICDHHSLASTDACNRMTIRLLGEKSGSFSRANNTTNSTVIDSVEGGEAVVLQVKYIYDWYVPFIGQLLGQDSNDEFILHHSEMFRTEYFERDDICS